MSEHPPPSNPPPNGTSNADVSASASGEPRGDRQNRRGGRGRGGRGRNRRRASGPDAADRRGRLPRADAGGVDDLPRDSDDRRPRRRRGKRGSKPDEPPSAEEAPPPRAERASESVSDPSPDASGAVDPTLNDNDDADGGKDARQRDKKGKQGKPPTAVDAPKRKRRPRNNRRRKSRPWLPRIPPGTVDPISLDPLEELDYPPFALVMEPPYIPIYPGMWPPTEEREEKKEEVENKGREREVEILKEQWGEGVVRSDASAARPGEANGVAGARSLKGRQFYLFDGYVLAGYLTRTLQFINPYNRRDLTREELAALDAYMAVHKLGNAGVVQAYDEKGVTLSTAGVAGQTADGRREILQQEASAIRNAFFRSGGGSAGALDRMGTQQRQRSRRQRQNNAREEMEGLTNEFQRMHRDQSRPSAPPAPREQENDTGIYAGDDGGFLMIDDDINPGLRSGIPVDDTGAMHSARHIAEQHSQQAQVREGNFPSLPSATATDNTNAAERNVPKPPAAPSKSLKSITKVVKKTDPAELAKQKKAREEAQRKAELSRLNYFDPTRAQPTVGSNGLLTAPIATEKVPPTEAVLERNRNFATALGVVPASIRNEQALSGWARPTAVDVQLDQFGNELNATQYPDSLLSQAKERMAELIKLEKIWKKFLADDKEASHSLKPMDRPTRVFVHEYSDFWRLKTQSYDPEGRRYIHCSKLMDTSAPYPLLSDAAKKWRGPVPGVPSVPYRAPVSLPSAAAAVSESTDGWHTEQRVPLKLAPRTAAEGDAKPSSTGMGMTRSSSTPLLSMTGEKPAPPRFADLHDKERPKLQLAPRTIPPSEESQRQAVQAERISKKEEARVHRQEYREKKRQYKEEKKKAILESAFASDDDGVDWSSDSDWFEDDAAFEGTDDEGM